MRRLRGAPHIRPHRPRAPTSALPRPPFIAHSSLEQLKLRITGNDNAPNHRDRILAPDGMLYARGGDQDVAAVLGHASATVTHEHYIDRDAREAQEQRTVMRVLQGGRP